MLLGINFKDKEPQAKTFLSELGNPYDLLAKDKNGKTFSEIWYLWNSRKYINK